MVLDRDSRIVRWAYFRFEKPSFTDHVPARTSLCVIFWRAVLWTPMKVLATAASLSIAIVVIGSVAFVALRYWTVRNPAMGLAVLLFVVAALGVIRLLVDLDRQHTYGTLPELTAPTRAWPVLYQGAKAVKSKVCPLVEIRRADR